MKSKTLRKRTRRRRGRRDVKKTKTKRGGMFHGAMSAARSNMGTTLYHDIIPLLTQYRYYLLTQEAPKAGDHVIVPHGEKHHTLFEGIEIDKGTKESIKNSKEDLENPVKGFGNLKTLYDKVTEGIKKKKKSKRGQIVQEQNSSFQSPRNQLSSHSPRLLASIDTMNELLRTPGKDYDPVTPQKVSGDEKGSQSVLTPRSFAPTIHNPRGDTTVQHLSFHGERGPDTTPPTSPDKITSPPRLPPKSRIPLSPSRPSRRLVLP